MTRRMKGGGLEEDKSKSIGGRVIRTIGGVALRRLEIARIKGIGGSMELRVLEIGWNIKVLKIEWN